MDEAFCHGYPHVQDSLVPFPGIEMVLKVDSYSPFLTKVDSLVPLRQEVTGR